MRGGGITGSGLKGGGLGLVTRGVLALGVASVFATVFATVALAFLVVGRLLVVGIDLADPFLAAAAPPFLGARAVFVTLPRATCAFVDGFSAAFPLVVALRGRLAGTGSFSSAARLRVGRVDGASDLVATRLGGMMLTR